MTPARVAASPMAVRLPALPIPVLGLLSMVAGVPPHAHCEICGTPVEVGERRCGSEACEQKFQDAIKAKKRGMWMFIGLIFLVMLFSVVGRNLL